MKDVHVECQRLMDWQELAKGCLIQEAATSLNFKTGDWRSMRPVWSEDKCIQCLFCWVYCPDSAILVEDEKVVGIDYEHCKGCEICHVECPTKPEKAITMEKKET